MIRPMAMGNSIGCIFVWVCVSNVWLSHKVIPYIDYAISYEKLNIFFIDEPNELDIKLNNFF
jgi:hypothetical protein